MEGLITRGQIKSIGTRRLWPLQPGDAAKDVSVVEGLGRDRHPGSLMKGSEISVCLPVLN